MLLLRETFPGQLRSFARYADEKHPKLPGGPAPPSQHALDELARRNAVDRRLFDAATARFASDFSQMLESLPPDRKAKRFRKRGGGFVLS